LSMEYSRLTPVAEKFGEFRSLERELTAARDMQDDNDAEMRDMGREEVARVAPLIERAEGELKALLIPRDPRDDKNIYLEVRAGTGGDEAAIFAGDLFRMYSRYAETHGFAVEILSENAGEHGGYREIISRFAGPGAFARFKFESGVHRVQRVPATEAQGRIHTSACTVAILAEADEVEASDLNPAELRVDTFRASGAGGQHVNKTSSAVRLTHIPSGIVVASQQERSQHKNKGTAMKMLKNRLYQLEAERQAKKKAELDATKSDVSFGNQIRSYVFQPYTMVNDHRTELKIPDVQRIMDGDIDEFIEAYLSQNGSSGGSAAA